MAVAPPPIPPDRYSGTEGLNRAWDRFRSWIADDLVRQWEYFTGLTARLNEPRGGGEGHVPTQQFFSLFAGAPSAAATRFAPVVGYGEIAPNATESTVYCVMPSAGTVRSAQVTTNSAPGVGKSLAYTLRKNGADTGLTFTLSGASLSATAAVDVAVAAGDLLTWKIVPSGTPTVTGVRLLTLFEPTTDNQFAYHGGCQTAATTTPRFAPALHYRQQFQAADTNEVTRDIIALSNGTIRNLYVNVDIAPGAGKSVTVILVKNGVEEASSSLVLSGTNTGANVTGLSIAVAQNDMIGFKLKSNVGAFTAANYSWGLVIEPGTSGEFQLQGGPGGGAYVPGARSTGQYTAQTTWAAAVDTATHTNYLMVPVRFSNLSVRLVTAPGAGQTRTLTHVQSAGGNLTCSFGATSTLVNDNTSVILPVGGTFILESNSSAAPAASSGNNAVVGRILLPSARLRTLMGVGL